MNESKVDGFFDKAKGKIKEALGDTFNDQSLANSGAADQVKGNAKEAWGNVKDSATNLGHSDTATENEVKAENTGHNLRGDITSGAENLKDSLKRGLDNIVRNPNT
jgi:uncharacterized protein YjbJ (UPF0337 family)